MNIPNLYRKIKQILSDGNVALINKGLEEVGSLNEASLLLNDIESIDRLQYVLSREIMEIRANDLDGVTTIGEHAFSGCNSLANITIPDGVTTIGEHAFSGCNNLKEVYVPSIESWLKINFTNMNSTPIQGGGQKLYFGENLVTNIIIPDSVTSIGNYAFSGCTGLTSVTIPDSVTNIGQNAFHYCTGLTSVTIPDSVTNIGQGAFGNCFNLRNIVVGNGITYIRPLAFSIAAGGGSANIYFRSITPPTLSNTGALPNRTYINLTIHVPIGSGDAYKSATNWSEFADNIVEDIALE